MSIRCQDILNFPSLKSLEIVGGYEGLGRIIRWVYLGDWLDDMNEIFDWIYGNELVIITDHMLKGNFKSLLSVLPKLNDMNISGIIINSRPRFSTIPPELTHLANELKLPIFKLPWEAMLVNITRDICYAITTEEIKEHEKANMLEKLLFEDIVLTETFSELMLLSDFDFSGKCIVGVMEVNNIDVFIKEHRYCDTKVVSDIMAYLLKSLNSAFSNYNTRVLTLQKNNSVIFLIHVTPHLRVTLNDVIKRVFLEITARFSCLTLNTGIGTGYENPLNYRKSFKQARQVLQIMQSEHNDQLLAYYDDVGIFSLLLNISDRDLMQSYYNSTLQAIIEYDKSTNAKLLMTLDSYLDHDMNIQSTADALFIHKNTLKYRLNKIQELLNCNLRSSQQLTRVYIALKVGKLLITDEDQKTSN